MNAPAQYTAQAARAEIRRRARAQLAKVAIERPIEYHAAVRQCLIDGLHSKQQAIVREIDNGQRYLSLCCTRRAGKTYLVGRLIVIMMLELKFGQDVVFIAPTMKRGRELIWDEISKVIDEFCLPWKPNASQLTWRTSTGGWFRVVGLDKEKQVGRVARGGNTRAFFSDECFPAGTLVDGRPIETIRVGDLVWSLDHCSGEMSQRTVIRVMMTPSHNIVTVRHSLGAVDCTCNHPFFVQSKGYVAAENITPGDLLCVRNGIPVRGSERRSQNNVLEGVSAETQKLDHECVPKSIGKPDEIGGYAQKTSQHALEHWSSPASTRWEWNGADGIGAADLVSSAEVLGPWSRDIHWEEANDVYRRRVESKRMGLQRTRCSGRNQQHLRAERMQERSRVCDPFWRQDFSLDRSTPPNRRALPDCLQGRLGVAGDEDCDRGGRCEPLSAEAQGPGSKEGELLVWSRVESVTRKEQGSDAGTAVYNLEVEGGHTYFANDVLVHNCQEYGHLYSKFVVAASPALAQLRGLMVASGTPGFSESGYWHEITHGKGGFNAYHWSLTDNPHLGRPAEDILAEELRDRYNGDDTHPDFLREWKGIWARDRNRLVFEFERQRDVVGDVPGYDRATWRHCIGVDFGHNDPCAWVVMTAHPHVPIVYVIHAEKHPDLTSDAIANKTKELFDRYRPEAVVGDCASGGSTFIKDWNVRYGARVGVRMRAAKKHDKAGSIKTFNTELRMGRLKLHGVRALELIDELVKTQYVDDERTAILEGAAFPDHCEDAARYCLNEFRTWGNKEPARDEPDEAELERRRVEQRNRAAVEELSGGDDEYA